MPSPVMKSLFSRLLFSATAILAACSFSIAARADTLSITVGQSAKVSVTADGTQPFTYQWYKNGVAISGATLADCVIGPAVAVTTVPDQYTATVTNTIDSTTSDIAYLTVTAGTGTPSPTITTQPIASVVTAGQSASFSVVATGTGALTYQWSKGGVAISGATGATFTISSATSADAGSYSVAVINTVSSVASSPTASTAVSLTVNPLPPTITTQPAAQSVAAGQSITFSVGATGTGSLAYQWTYGGGNISGATAATYTISNASSANAGNYAVTVTNTVGGLISAPTTSVAVSLTVTAPAAPTITTQPTAKSVTVGQSATFTAVATGSGTLTYQWTKGGSNISGATLASYTISSVASADAGTYAVAITNTVNSMASAVTISTVVSLTVTAPAAPTITTQPAAKSVTVGQSAAFTVVATGSGTLSYQWTKGGVAISGATGATYTISSTASTDNGLYAVSVINTVSSMASAATVSNSVALIVAPTAPAITSQPVAQTVTAGQPATFTVIATGSGTLSYQWTKGGVAIFGAIAATYTISATASTDAGNYAVSVVNTVSSVASAVTTSTAVSLTVNPALVGPTITTQPTAQSVTVGQSATFSVVATGSGTLTYQWWKGGVAISGATAATYTIATTVSIDAGSYAVVVTNSVSSVTSTSTTLTVNAAPVGPVISTQPVAQAKLIGQSVSFTVAATGSATLTYQWTKNAANISGATSATYSIPSVSIADAGNYAVVVTNSVSSVTSASVALTVTPTAPIITTPPTAQSVTVGQSATFSVLATGSGSLSYQWIKGGAVISGATVATYTIPATVSADAGNYAVAVVNIVSSVASAATTSTAVSLTVNAALVGPSIATQPVARTVTAGQSVSFSVTATGSATLTYQWTKNGASIAGATATIYTIANAASGDAGNYAVVVTNSVTSVTSSSVALVVSALAAPVPDGFASATTGGAAGQTVTVSTAVDFKTYAQSTTAYVINVTGTINLGGSALVKSNKTIQGLDANAAIIGCLDLSSGGVSNVIIRGMTISNPGTTIVSGAYTDGGDGITIRNATNVFITHCSLFNCADQLIEISTGADNVTVSWSEFYYNSAQTVHRYSMITGVAGSETKPLHVTLHHNWWSDLCDASMPSGTYGYVHFYNNYFKATGNASSTDARDNAQFFAESNVYEQINDPLYKENVDTSLPAGRIRGINNVFTTCTGKAADAGADAIFTPTYSYELLPTADVTAVAVPLCGNTAGAASATPTASVAAITGPIDVVPANSSFTLTAAPSGFTGVSYQWRRNNFDLSGATASTYTVSSAQTANAGIYTVVIGLAAGDFVVSSPLTIELGISGGSSSSSSSGGSSLAATTASSGGGGGAPSSYFLLVLVGLGILRKASRRGRS